MSQTKRLVLLTGAALGVCAAGAAQAATNTDEVRAIVAEMMADAETRSSLLAGGDAGHDGKFFIAGDGFRLNVGGQIQFRYILGFRDDENTGDDFSNGFQMRRAKLDMTGSIYRNWDFRLLSSFDRDGGDAGLEEAWFRYNFDNGMKLRGGQFKLPMLREELVSSSKQLAVERSVTNEAFTQDRSQGLELAAEYEAWRWAVAFSDGLDSENTDYNDAGPASGIPFVVRGEAEYAFTGRVEFLFGGNWKQFEDFTSQKGQDFGFMIGGAAHYQQSTQTQLPTDFDTDTLQFTVDASLEGDGWNLFGAFIYRFQEQTPSVASGGGDDIDLSDFGVVIQGGWRFDEKNEIFARWDAIFADEDRFSSGEDNFNFLTAGLNHYYAGHAAKASVDVIWSFQDTSNLATVSRSPIGSGVGILGDMEENEVAVRLQFQLLF